MRIGSKITWTFSALLFLLWWQPFCTVHAQEPIRIVAFGDSLMAGRGLPVADGFTSQLQNALGKLGHSVSIINASVSGDTTSGGLARLDWILSEPSSAVILFLGYNDAFRAAPVDLVESNLAAMIENIQARQLPLLFAGAMAPRNLGAEYYQRFDAIYPRLAEKYDVIFFPFFLEGVATDPNLNQSDGIHPNARGVSVIVHNITPYVIALIDQIKN